LPHTDVLELAPLAALGALDEPDRRSFEGHLAEGCAECAASLVEWRNDLARLALSVPPVDPPAALRARVLEPAGRRGLPRDHRFAGPRWLALAAGVVLAVAAVDDMAQRRFVRESRRRAAALSVQLQHSREEIARRELRVRFVEDPDVLTIFLSGLGPAPGSRGKILYSAKARRAILVAADLPPVEPGRQFELWFIAGGKPIAAGTFDRRDSGATVFESSPLPEGAPPVEKFAVTIEPRGGVSQPTGPMVLLGASSPRPG
jgi:anti-sigma-K factor RskA